MNKEMICPYCKKQLLQNEHTLFYYCDCPESRYMNGHPVLWQAMIDAKKAQEDVDRLQNQNSILFNYVMDFMRREKESADKYMSNKSRSKINHCHNCIRNHLKETGIDS